jgi:hypothetical protein
VGEPAQTDSPSSLELKVSPLRRGSTVFYLSLAPRQKAWREVST